MAHICRYMALQCSGLAAALWPAAANRPSKASRPAPPAPASPQVLPAPACLPAPAVRAPAPPPGRMLLLAAWNGQGGWHHFQCPGRAPGSIWHAGVPFFEGNRRANPFVLRLVARMRGAASRAPSDVVPCGEGWGLPWEWLWVAFPPVSLCMARPRSTMAPAPAKVPAPVPPPAGPPAAARRPACPAIKPAAAPAPPPWQVPVHRPAWRATAQASRPAPPCPPAAALGRPLHTTGGVSEGISFSVYVSPHFFPVFFYVLTFSGL